MLPESLCLCVCVGACVSHFSLSYYVFFLYMPAVCLDLVAFGRFLDINHFQELHQEESNEIDPN